MLDHILRPYSGFIKHPTLPIVLKQANPHPQARGSNPIPFLGHLRSYTLHIPTHPLWRLLLRPEHLS